MKVKNLRGTRDFYPPLKRKLNYIFSIWKTVGEKYGYEDMDGPLLEPADLWRLKSGAEIPDQMYVFTDKGGREVAVRPELTPSVARMVAQKQKELSKPIKWYSIGRFWRYERAQAGRLREFYQLNLDCLGPESMLADAEVISTSIAIMRGLGCTKEEFYVRLSNRNLMKSLLLKVIRIKEDQLIPVSRLIDKREKIGDKGFIAALKDVGLNATQAKYLLKMLEKNDISKIKGSSLDAEGKKGLKDLKELLSYLDSYGYGDYCEVDLSIMRGFDYYTSTVFEVFDRSGEFRALAGGGRYEDLVKDFGGDKCAGVGYGMGDVVLALFLEKLDRMPKLRKRINYYIAPLTDKAGPVALKIASVLRMMSNVEVGLDSGSLKKQLKYANSIGAEKVIIIGEKDLKNNKVTVKDMEREIERVLDIGDLLKNNLP
jgi:histidyl-tRNA synthetase